MPVNSLSTYHTWASRKTRKAVWICERIVTYIVLISIALVLLMPFVWMLSTALKPRTQVYVFPPVLIPRPPQWGHFGEAINAFPFFRYLCNTSLIAGMNILGVLVSSTMVAYSFARLRWPGKNVAFMLLLSTMMLPPQVTMIPLFIIYRSLGWVDTYLPLVIPVWLGGRAFNIFLLRQFFLTVPVELNDAAKIDGCGELGIFRKIYMPLSKPALTSVAVFTFMSEWNDFMGPLIYLNDMNKYTLTLGLYAFQSEEMVQWNYLMAASVLMLLPCLVVFFFAQKLFVQGITLTGLKG